MPVWFILIVLSGVFTLGWCLGSALGYQNGRRHAEDLADLRDELLADILADDTRPVSL